MFDIAVKLFCTVHIHCRDPPTELIQRPPASCLTIHNDPSVEKVDRYSGDIVQSSTTA